MYTHISIRACNYTHSKTGDSLSGFELIGTRTDGAVFDMTPHAIREIGPSAVYNHKALTAWVAAHNGL